MVDDSKIIVRVVLKGMVTGDFSVPPEGSLTSVTAVDSLLIQTK